MAPYTDMRKKTEARLRELAPRGQRQPGCVIMQPSLRLLSHVCSEGHTTLKATFCFLHLIRPTLFVCDYLR